jgi:alpha-ketoglutarate-dependent taurine dioxygenase
MEGGSSLSLLNVPNDRRWILEREVASRVGEYGYVYLHDVPDSFDHSAFVASFGELMPQYDGKLIWDIKPEAGMDDIYHSRNTQSLVPHTEAYEYPGRPPRYVALWCVKQASGEGGATTLADGYAMLEDFTDAERQIMCERQYNWHSSTGLARTGISFNEPHPILDRASTGEVILRYSLNNVTGGDRDTFLTEYLGRGAEFFQKNFRGIDIERNGLLFWDNWRMLHSRTAFRDRERHLKRALVSC